MKKLLLSITLLVGFNSFAQLTCATAIELTADETVSVPELTGTYQAICWGTAAAAPNAIWYKFTPTQNGEVTVNADLPQNQSAPFSNDQRVSIATGTCAALTCYAGYDDIDDTNYNVNYTFPVQSGTTYYIVWDNRWLADGFDFDFSFVSASCIRPNDISINTPTNITTTSATLNWAAAIGTPPGYDVEYGVAGFAPGTGTVASTSTTSVSLTTGLTASSNSEYYLRSDCGTSESAWVGPFTLFLAKTLPYANGFETPQLSDGFAAAGWGLGNAASGAQAGTIYYFSSSSTTAASNSLLFSRAISLQANEQVTLTFYTRLGSATGTNNILKVWVNGLPSATGATQLGADITVSGATYTLQTRTFTATAPGIYYFIFNNVTPIVTAATSLRLDTFNLTSVLSNDEFLSSEFSVYPNPVNNVINFSNNVNALVSSVKITDLNGRVVKTLNVNGTEGQISVSDLASGMYMLNITSDKGTAVKKIDKQ